MTVSTTATRASYTGNAVSTAFSAPFAYLATSEIKVYVNDVLQSTGYSVSAPGSSGTVTFSSAPANGAKIVIRRETALTQNIDYVANDAFAADVTEGGFDRAMLAVQDVDAKANRALRVADHLPAIAPIADPNAVVLAWAQQFVSVKAYGAQGNGTTDDTAAVNEAVAANRSDLLLPVGDYRLSGNPTNPYGTHFTGPGRLLKSLSLSAIPFDFQINSYADDGKVALGHEYLYRAFQRLTAFAFTSSTSNLEIEIYGDSTVTPIGGQTSPYYLVNMLPAMFRARGIPNVTVTNRGVGGTKISDMDVLSHLSTTLDLIFIKYGINDAADVYTMGFDAALAQFTTTLRSKLAAIRAAANGAVGNLSIVLIGPNSTYAQYGQNTPWYEAVRNVYVQAARDYQCAYFDAYGYLRDSTQAAGLWMDSTSGAAIHPLNAMMAWIWGGVMDAFFGQSETRPFATNHLTNDGDVAYPSAAPTDAPTTYPRGISIRRAKSANGWPVDGVVVTVRSADEVVEQRNFSATISTYPYVLTRTNVSAGSSWTGWTGLETTATLQNGWANFAAGYSDFGFYMTEDKTVHLKGVIAGGTVTAGTLIFTLPAGMRPAKIALVPVFLGNQTIGCLSIATNGQVTAQTGLNATYTSFDGANFRAA